MCCALLPTQPQIFTQIEIIIPDSKPALINKKNGTWLQNYLFFHPVLTMYYHTKQNKEKKEKGWHHLLDCIHKDSWKKVIYTLQDQVSNGDTA